MKNIKKYNSTIINVLFLMFPLSAIFGNFFINLNTLLLSVTALIFYTRNIIKFKTNFLDQILLGFFYYIFLVLVINFFESYLSNEIFPKRIVSKTLFYFRYLVLYLVIRALISQKILRLDWFSLTCAVCASLVCLDIFFQFFTGKDIFGIEAVSARHYSGVFGDELIAGGYLQKFALFSFFLPFVIKKNFFQKNLIQFLLLIIFGIGISLSGNRMPFILFIFSLIVYFILDKKLGQYKYKIFTILFLFLFLNFNLNQTFKINTLSLYSSVKNIVSTFLTKDLASETVEVWKKPYVTEFYCFQYVWKQNLFFGGGVRSYSTVGDDPMKEGCNTHPHNYYFEILSDLGIFGLSIILFFIFMLLYKFFIKNNNSFRLNSNILDVRIIPFFLIFLTDFFPLRTSGGFFSTNNATLIFIVLAILVSLISQKKLYNN
jgi:O-antigen ligase